MILGQPTILLPKFGYRVFGLASPDEPRWVGRKPDRAWLGRKFQEYLANRSEFFALNYPEKLKGIYLREQS